MLGRVLRQNRRFGLTALLVAVFVYLYAATLPEPFPFLYTPIGVLSVALAAMLVVGIPLVGLVIAFPVVVPNLEEGALTMILLIPADRATEALGLPGWGR